MRTGPTVALVALTSLVCTAGGGNAAPPRESQTATSHSFRLGSGPATRTFTVRRPAGIVRLTRITTTYGIRASVEATVGRLMAVSVSNDPERFDPVRTCRREGGLYVCTQPQEGCPAPAAVWHVTLRKARGPTGIVRFDFVVGQ